MRNKEENSFFMLFSFCNSEGARSDAGSSAAMLHGPMSGAKWFAARSKIYVSASLPDLREGKLRFQDIFSQDFRMSVVEAHGGGIRMEQSQPARVSAVRFMIESLRVYLLVVAHRL